MDSPLEIEKLYVIELELILSHMNNQEFVLEFIIHHLECKNNDVRKSPILLSMEGTPDLLISPKIATVCKITYNKGKRIRFSHAYLSDMKATFILLYGHGDPSVRAACSLDFFELIEGSDSSQPKIYEIEIGMNGADGNHFGTLFLSFQVFPAKELLKPNVLLMKAAKTSRVSSRPSTSRISVRPQTSRNVQVYPVERSDRTFSSMGTKSGLTPKTERYDRGERSSRSELQIPIKNINTHPTPPDSGRSNGSTIHERYMESNEKWIGNHFSTKTSSYVVSKSGRSSARSSGRPK